MSDTAGKGEQFFGVTKKLASKLGKSAAEVLQGAANFKQAGFTVQEAFKLQEVALRSATVSNLDVIDSSKILVRILKGFKAPASEAARVLDIMNEVSNKFATNLGELATGMAQLSPVSMLMEFLLCLLQCTTLLEFTQIQLVLFKETKDKVFIVIKVLAHH